MKKSLTFLFLLSLILLSGTFIGSRNIAYAVDVSVASPANYTPLAPITLGNTVDANGNPQSNTPIRTDTVVDYIIDMYRFAVGISAVLALLMIIIGGVQYMSTDAIYGKSEGKERIQQALWGFLLVIISWLILYNINPSFVSLQNIFSTTKTTGNPAPAAATPSTATPTTPTPVATTPITTTPNNDPPDPSECGSNFNFTHNCTVNGHSGVCDGRGGCYLNPF